MTLIKTRMMLTKSVARFLANMPKWILQTGRWKDSGLWMDNKKWKDNP